MDGTRDPTGAPTVTPRPTPYPTSVPTSAPTYSACDYTQIMCGQTMDGTTQNHRDVGGGPAREKNYRISFDEPTRIFGEFGGGASGVAVSRCAVTHANTFKIVNFF